MPGPSGQATARFNFICSIRKQHLPYGHRVSFSVDSTVHDGTHDGTGTAPTCTGINL